MDIAVLIGLEEPAGDCATCRHLEAIVRHESFSCACCGVDQLMDEAARRHPDVVIAEITRGTTVERFLRQLRRASPGTRTLLAATIPTQDIVIGAIRGGAAGILQGPLEPDEVAQALAAVHAGGAWYDHDMLYQTLHQCLITAAVAPPRQSPPETPLTPREEEVLVLIGDGLSNKEIARRLAISDTTVKTYLHRIYTKLNRSGRYKAFRAKPRAPLPSAWGTLV